MYQNAHFIAFSSLIISKHLFLPIEKIKVMLIVVCIFLFLVTSNVESVFEFLYSQLSIFCPFCFELSFFLSDLLERV